MNTLLKIVKNRNTILILAIVLGISVGDIAQNIKEYTFYILATVLSFSTTGIVMEDIKNKKFFISSMAQGILLNYLLFGTTLVALAYFFADNASLFNGFVVIAVSPPGVAIIPFSSMLKANVNRSTIGTAAGFLVAIFLAPIMIKILTGNNELKFMPLFYNMVKIIIVPFIISRILLLNTVKKITLKVRGQVVNWGFALIIFTAVGINRHIFIYHLDEVFKVGLILFIAMFILGQTYDYIIKRWVSDERERMSQNLLLTLKSSGFSVVVSLQLFGGDAVIPSAVLSVLVLAYLLFLTFKSSFLQWIWKK
ncbi:MAG: hypothetical protein JXR60_00565 [Bacteroidales bacterium]|nr:hypothetical protein [Bacteroidales bacterium]